MGTAIGVTYQNAAGLGLVQGLTEFLPISSSGHLRLAESYLGGISQPLVLDVALHVGTLLAVIVYYRVEVRALLMGLLPGGAEDQRREVGWILVASVPTALIGLGLKKAGVGHLGPPHVAAGLLLTAALNYSTTRTQGGEAPMDLGRAAAIGVVQGIAVLPGVSRSGSTIAVGMALGLPALTAARFSFLCSIPAVGGAALLLFKDYLEAPAGFPPGPVGVGILVSFLVGLACLGVLMRQLRTGTFKVWSIYCLVLAVLVGAAHLSSAGGAG